MKDIKEIIAENIIALRKKEGLTQAQLANKLNYSDNTISRWERAELTPSVETLELISKLFNVPIESLLHENIIEISKEDRKIQKIKKLATILLCLSMIWLLAIVAFFYCSSFFNLHLWILFVWAVPLSCIILGIFAKYWRSKVYLFVVTTIFIWSLIACFYLQFLQYNLYLMFLIGIPAQLALTVWTFVMPKKIKTL